MTSTNIPDWYYFEFGLDYPFISSSSTPEKQRKDSVPPALPLILTPGIFARVHNMSPITDIDKIRAEVLLLIGASDLRVSQTQGIEFDHADDKPKIQNRKRTMGRLRC